VSEKRKTYTKNGYFRCRCGAVAMPLTDDTQCDCGDIYEQEWYFFELPEFAPVEPKEAAPVAPVVVAEEEENLCVICDSQSCTIFPNGKYYCSVCRPSWQEVEIPIIEAPVVVSAEETRTINEEMRIARSKWWDYALDKPMNVFGAFEAGFKAAHPSPLPATETHDEWFARKFPIYNAGRHIANSGQEVAVTTYEVTKCAWKAARGEK
jgi:hypothetical protein